MVSEKLDIKVKYGIRKLDIKVKYGIRKVGY